MMYCVDIEKWIDYDEYLRLCQETGKTIKTNFVYFGGWPVYQDEKKKEFNLEY